MAFLGAHLLSHSSCPQIEKIMTLIGAGIESSRDQQGRVDLTDSLWHKIKVTVV